MALLIDLFGYLSILLHGVTIAAQSMAVGGTVFLLLLARPFAHALPDGEGLLRRTGRIAGWAALALAACQLLALGMQAAVLMDTVGLGVAQALSAQFAVADLIEAAAAAALAVLLLRGGAPAVMKTHAAARLVDGPLLLAATALHILGAAIWIGGIPSFLMMLGRLRDGASFARVGTRFSRISVAGVVCIVVSAAVMSVL